MRLLLRVEVVPHSNVDVGPGSCHRAAAGDGLRFVSCCVPPRG
jgi:hypothetical protein